MKSMPRILMMILLLAAVAGCATGDANRTTDATTELEGRWVVVSSEANGHKGPDAPTAPGGVSTLVFHGTRETALRGGVMWAESTFSMDAGKSPKTLDETLVKGVGNVKKFEGKKSLAIYEIKGDMLKVCWTIYGVDRERPTEFAASPDSHLLFDVCKREKK